MIAHLAEDGFGPERTRVDGDVDDGVRVSVAVDESDYEAMMKRMKDSGADRVNLNRAGPDLDRPGRPRLTDPEPPPPHRSG